MHRSTEILVPSDDANATIAPERVDKTIPGYRYSVGPVVADVNERTIPGYRYSMGPVFADEPEEFFTLKPEVPPKAPTRRLTKRIPSTPSLPPPPPAVKTPEVPKRHPSIRSLADSGIDVGSRRSSKHATMSSISSKASSTLVPISECGSTRRPATLTPMSDAFMLGPEYHGSSSPLEERFVFSITKPKRSSCFVGKLMDHFKEKSQIKKEQRVSKREEEMFDAHTKSNIFLDELREKRALEKSNGRTPMWLSSEEKKIVENQRRQVLELRLEKALKGRRYRVAHQIDGELRILGVDGSTDEDRNA